MPRPSQAGHFYGLFMILGSVQKPRGKADQREDVVGPWVDGVDITIVLDIAIIPGEAVGVGAFNHNIVGQPVAFGVLVLTMAFRQMAPVVAVGLFVLSLIHI